MMQCFVFKPDYLATHYHAGSGDAQCFYLPPFNISELHSAIAKDGGRMIARHGRIEVTSQDDELHAHPGLTFVTIVAGSGVFRTAEGDHKVRAGDKLIIPPNVLHLSVADTHTTMIEDIVYIGAEYDVQSMVPFV